MMFVMLHYPSGGPTNACHFSRQITRQVREIREAGGGINEGRKASLQYRKVSGLMRLETFIPKAPRFNPNIGSNLGSYLLPLNTWLKGCSFTKYLEKDLGLWLAANSVGVGVMDLYRFGLRD